jgi:hypothetical protein
VTDDASGKMRLLERGQDAGQIRSDVSIAELLALLLGASRAVEQMGGNCELEARTVRVILDGLRVQSPGKTTQTSPPPAWNRNTANRVL